MNIIDALKLNRPTDKIIRILSNKFAVVQTLYTNGNYSENRIVGISRDDCTVYLYGNEGKHIHRYLAQIANFEYDNIIVGMIDYRSKNGRYYVKQCRKLLHALKLNNI